MKSDGITKVIRIHWEPWMSGKSFMAIHQTIVKRFQFGPSDTAILSVPKNIYLPVCFNIILEALVKVIIPFHHHAIQRLVFSHISMAILLCDGSVSQSGVKTFHNVTIHPHSGTLVGGGKLWALCHTHTHTNKHTHTYFTHLSQNKWAAPLLSVSLIWMKEPLGDLTTLISTPMESVWYSCSWWNTLPGDATLPPQMIPSAEQRLSAMKGQWWEHLFPLKTALQNKLFSCCKEHFC